MKGAKIIVLGLLQIANLTKTPNKFRRSICDSTLETALILRVSLRVMLLKDSGVLSQESGLLFLDNIALSCLFLSLEFLFLSFSLALSLVDDELLLPQTFDFALVFQLTHAASLSIHLLKSVILCEFLHQLALELFLHAFLFFGTFSLESKLIFTSCL